MSRWLDFTQRWGAAVLVMAAIFALSSRPSAQLPNFGVLDGVFKKGGHIIGYGLLALTYWRGFRWAPARVGTSWLLAVLYGLTDELHQALVPGRSPSAVDILLFDGLGAALALGLQRWRQKAPSPSSPEQ